MTYRRLLSCIEQWPECSSGEYNPSCCRFPKSCSCMADDEKVADYLLEPAPARPAAEVEERCWWRGEVEAWLAPEKRGAGCSIQVRLEDDIEAPESGALVRVYLMTPGAT